MKQTMKDAFPSDSEHEVLLRVRLILRTPEMSDVIEHANKIMKILEDCDTEEVKEIMKERNDVDMLNFINTGEKVKK